MKKDVVAGIDKIGIKNSVSSSYHRFVKRGLSGITASSRVLPNLLPYQSFYEKNDETVTSS